VTRHLIWRLNLLLPGNTLATVRARLWAFAGFDVCPTARIDNSARLMYGDIRIGDDTFIGAEVMITGGRVSIGARCDLAPRIVVHAGSHEVGDHTRRAGPEYEGTVEVGDGTWIGAGAILLDGARIGEGSVVAAGSVVRDEFPPDSFIAGVPAELKRRLDGSS
jgi:acetyltransferase-like isoleucine patch superfamily enzyme